jgi:integrase
VREQSADGMPVDPNLATRAFKKVIAKAGLPKLTIHGLRHTHATILLEQGV